MVAAHHVGSVVFPGAAKGLAKRYVSAQVAGAVTVIGGDQRLAGLRAELLASTPGRPVTRVLTGMGGVGKTSLARDQLDDNQHLQHWAHAAHILLHTALPQQPVNVRSLEMWNALRTHGATVLTHSDPNHPDTLFTHAGLADWTGQAGDAAAARDLFAELLTVHERVLGTEHPNTLTTRSNLAYWTRKAAGRPILSPDTGSTESSPLGPQRRRRARR